MTLPVLLSVPHAGLWVPPEVEHLCILTEKEIIRDGDEGAAEIYLPLEKDVAFLVTTEVARAIVDVNREEDNFDRDGVIKTHTCWDVPIYGKLPSDETIDLLIDKYYKPYHAKLSQIGKNAKLGIDCHTMAAKGPPIGPDPNQYRPAACLSNANGTFPWPWMYSLAWHLQKQLRREVLINQPFRGGHIIRKHAREMPWVQLELSRNPFIDWDQKRLRLLGALKNWWRETFD